MESERVTKPSGTIVVPRRPWRPAWYELLPEVALAIGLGWFLIDQPDAATSAFKSTRAVILITTMAVVWIALRVVLARLAPWRAVRTAVFGLAAAGVFAVVVLPAYMDKTVVEAFPPTPTTRPVGPSSSTPSTSTLPATTATGPDRAPTTTATTIPPTTLPAEPLRLRTASLEGIDHRASGTVSIYRAPDGRHVVGLEAIDIQPGPDYDVYVVPGSDRDSTDDGIRLDDLRGNKGTQYYEVPADVGIGSGEWTVLVWCQTFAVPIANATPT